MQLISVRVLVSITLVLVVASLRDDSGVSEPRVASGATHDVAVGNQLLTNVPVAFIPNLGQWPHAAHYTARLGPMTMCLEQRGWWLRLAQNVEKPRDPRALRIADPNVPSVRGVSLHMTFSGSAEPTLVGEDRLAGMHNYFLGNDPALWRTSVPRFGAVVYRGMYPGIDVRAYGRDGHFEFDLVLQPGADLARVEVHVEGADAMRIDKNGTLVIDTSVGPVRLPRPLTYASHGDARHPVACDYELRGDDRFTFVAAPWDGDELVVDPALLYSTYLGGTGNDSARAVSVDAAGVVTLTGYTVAPDFPTTAGAWSSRNIWLDIIVTRVDPSRPRAQQLVYSTFLGGLGLEFADDLWVDAEGRVTVVGQTESADYPTTPGAWDTTYDGSGDAYVSRLDPRLLGAQQLVYSTRLGGSAYDEGRALSVDANGVVTVTGNTISTDFSTTADAWDRTHNGGVRDCFVACLNPKLPSVEQLVYSTFLGGTNGEGTNAMLVDPPGVVTILGGTSSVDFPTTSGAWDTTYNGGGDAFLAQLNISLPSASQLAYSTFLGGTSYEEPSDLAYAGGVATVVGTTYSADFPLTANAWDRTREYHDAFVTRFEVAVPGAQRLVYSSYLGGSRDESAATVSVDAAGVVIVAGSTASPDFPTSANAADATLGGDADGFVTCLDTSLPSSRQLVYSTFFGGSWSDGITDLSVDLAGVATMIGGTTSRDFPTTPEAWDRTFHDRSSSNTGDAFITRFSLRPQGVRRFGASSQGCNGPLDMYVNSTPRVGNATFALTCNQAPRSGIGVLLISRGLLQPIYGLGVNLWVDPYYGGRLVLPTTSNAAGEVSFALPLPENPWLINRHLHAQFAWRDLPSPPFPPPCPPLAWSATMALEITIQPR